MVFLIYVYDLPIQQIGIISLIHTLVVILFLVLRPLNDLNETIKAISCEVLLSISLFFIWIYAVDDQVHFFEYSQRFLLGWCIIGL
jgi:hypothetical protein